MRAWALAATLLTASEPAILGQHIGSSLSGMVVDPQGLPVQAAKVRLRHLGDGAEWRFETRASGAFQAPSLTPGDYAIEIEKEGFAKTVVELVRLMVGEHRSVRAILSPAGLAQQITVTAEVAAVNLASGDQSASLGRAVLELPTVSSGVGRNFRTQVYLTPGVAISSGAHRPFTVSGARNRNNSYLIDSNDYNEIEGGLLMGRGSSEQLISLEALDGIQVLTHNFKAEHGRQNGAIISMVTKRGTNQWRGLAYEYLRNNVLDARNSFDPVRPPLRFNQFGGNLGGPLQRNRTFLFANWEGFLRRTTNATTVQTLRPEQRAQAVAAIRPLAAMYPEPNLPGSNLFRANARTGGDQFSWVARIDHELSDRMRLFTRYTHLRSNSFGVAGAALQRFNTFSAPSGYSLHHIWSPDSRTVNEARFNYTRFVLRDQFRDPVLLGDPAVNGEVGTVIVNGLSQLGHFAFMRRATAQNNFQWTDDLSRVMGAHAMKVGFAVRRLQLNSGTISPGFSGILRFNSVTDFLAARAVSYNRNIGNPYIGQRATEYNAYMQDDWQVHPRLVLNLGLRYEFNTVPLEVNRLIDSRYTFAPDRNNFAPRFGFAWRADRNGRTAIRGGYGIYYNVLELSFVGLTRFNPPLVGNIAAANPQFPNLAGNAQQTIPTGLVVPQRDARQPYNQHFHLTVERQAGPVLLSAAYVSTISLKAPRTSRPNGGDGLLQALRPDPTVGVVNRLETAAASNYHSLQTLAQWQARGVFLRAAYTWSKFLDQVSDFPTGNQNIDRGLLALDENNWRLNYGPSDLDLRHVATIAWSYELPWARQRRWLGGWQLQGITTLQSGRPFTLFAGVDTPVGNNNNRILDLPGALVRLDASNRRAIELAPGFTRAQLTPARGALGTIGRNTERADALLSFNASVVKPFRLGERWNLQVRAESFNLFNQVNYGLPDGLLTSPNFGQAITAADPRQIQLALRLTF